MPKNEIYYFLGNTTSHIVHALPIYRKIGGTFVTLSTKATKEVKSKYKIANVINIDNIPYSWQRFGWKVKPIYEYDTIDDRFHETIEFLNKNAKVVVFYDLFDFIGEIQLTSPVKIFLTHGNMLKNYMENNGRLKKLEQYDYMAAIGPSLKVQLQESYSIASKKLLNLGIARTDEIIEHTGEVFISDVIKNILSLDTKNPIISYLPTFWGDSSIYTVGFDILRNFPDNYTLIFRPHPQTPKKHLKRYLDYINTSKKSIIYIPDGKYESISLTDIFNMSSAIIGDVSSVMLDAILTKKPLLFAASKNVTNKPISQYAEYDSIRDVVQKSQYISEENIHNLKQILEISIKHGIDESIWQKTIEKLYFNTDRSSVEKISQFISSQIT